MFDREYEYEHERKGVNVLVIDEERFVQPHNIFFLLFMIYHFLPLPCTTRKRRIVPLCCS